MRPFAPAGVLAKRARNAPPAKFVQNKIKSFDLLILKPVDRLRLQCASPASAGVLTPMKTGINQNLWLYTTQEKNLQKDGNIVKLSVKRVNSTPIFDADCYLR